MNLLAGWMMRLYPAKWRARYGDELQVLLADTGADARVVTDLFRGGMKMQFSTWSFPKLALVLGFAGILAGVAGSFLIAPVYTSKATLEILPTAVTGAPTTTALNDRIQQLQTSVMTRTSLNQMIQDPHLLLYTDELKTTPLEDVIEDMKRNIRVEIVALPGKLGRQASAFNIVFSYPDARKARDTVQRLMEAFQKEHGSSGEMLPPFAGTQLVVLDPASFPVRPVSPNPWTWVIVACAFGIFVWALRLLFQRRWLGAVGGVVLALAVYGFAEFVTIEYLEHQYRSTATLRIVGGEAQDVANLTNDALSPTSLSMIVNDPRLRLYQTELKTMPLEDVIRLMRQHLVIRRLGPYAFTLAFDYFDRFKAQQTVTAVVDILKTAQEARRTWSVDKTPATQGTVLHVLDPASLPVVPSKPNRATMAIIGFIAGLSVAAITALIRRRWKPNADVPADAITS